MPTRRRRCLLRIPLLLALAAGCGGEPDVAAPPPGGFSLLAVGDTGEEPSALGGTPGQLAVARAMVDADRAAPVEALVFLGDNFYPDGLKERKFKDRLRANFVQPYCHFLELTARGRGSMESWCAVPEEERHPVPILAVLGNHDYGERESPLLQHKRIPQYVENWSLPDTEDLVGVRELGGGVSLILLQSVEITERGASAGALREALESSRGPWRIVAAHHPIAHPGDGYAEDYAREVRRVLDASGVPVQLFLAGHEHSLQLAAPDGEPPLVVVSGGGHEAKELESPAPDRLFAAESAGFARVDLRSDAEGPHLQVTLVGVETGLGARGGGRELVRYRVAPDASFREVPPDAEGAPSS